MLRQQEESHALSFARARKPGPERRARNDLTLQERTTAVEKPECLKAIRQACRKVLQSAGHGNEEEYWTEVLRLTLPEELRFANVAGVANLTPGLIRDIAKKRLIDLGKQEKWLVRKGRKAVRPLSLDVETKAGKPFADLIEAKPESREISEELIDATANRLKLTPLQRAIFRLHVHGERQARIAARIHLTESRVSQLWAEIEGIARKNLKDE